MACQKRYVALLGLSPVKCWLRHCPASAVTFLVCWHVPGASRRGCWSPRSCQRFHSGFSSFLTCSSSQFQPRKNRSEGSADRCTGSATVTTKEESQLIPKKSTCHGYFVQTMSHLGGLVAFPFLGIHFGARRQAFFGVSFRFRLPLHHLELFHFL